MRPIFPITRRPLLALALACVAFGEAGCVGHNFPKDAYAESVESTVNTPWGPMIFKARTLATGAAAKNASLPDAIVPPLKPLPRAEAAK